MGRELILASGSRWRLQMLAGAGVRARGIASLVDEDLTVDSDPVRLSMDLALAKAEAVHQDHPAAWVLGADQVACDDTERSRIWGKPEDPEDHFRRLWAMRGRTHVLVTGWALLGRRYRRGERLRCGLHGRGTGGLPVRTHRRRLVQRAGATTAGRDGRASEPGMEVR